MGSAKNIHDPRRSRTRRRQHRSRAYVCYATAIGGIYKGRLALMTRATYEKEKRELATTGQSYFQLTTSNGLISAVYNKETDRVGNVVSAYFLLYYDSAKFVSPVAFNISLREPMQPLSARYLNNTHVIEVKYNKISVYYFAPFTTHEKILYAVVKDPLKQLKISNFQV